MTIYSFAGVEALWTNNGGNPGWAPLAAAIAMSESGGNSSALNNNPSTGDYSVGLWQINYYNGLNASRTAAYGSSASLLADDNAQAKAAISLSGNGTNWGPWKTDNAWNAWVAHGSPNQPSEATVATWGVSMGGAGVGSPTATTGSAIGNAAPGATSIGSQAPIAGFGSGIQVSDLVIAGTSAGVSLGGAIQDAILMRTTQAASNITLQITDPYREVLRGNLFSYGSNLEVDGLTFTGVQITKAGESLSWCFEASGVAALRQFIGVQATSDTTDLTGFVYSLVSAVPSLGFVAQSTPLDTAVSVGRGTGGDTEEDLWTCIQRVVTSAGWRCFEVQNVIYLGSDQFFLGGPTQGTLMERTANIMDIDFDYDIGKPVGNATVTGISNNWGYPPGAVVVTSGMGPMDGQPWLVQDCQRSLLQVEMTSTIYVPMTPQEVITGTSTEAPF